MTLPEYPAVRSLACLIVTSLVPFAAHAQNMEGMTIQETPGIALIKPQSWSKESDATVLEFTAYVDRRATGNAAAGYYEFLLPSGNKRQVDSSKVVKVVIYPDESRIVSLVEPVDRDRVATSVREMTDVTARFPATRPHLLPHLREIATVIERYDAGEVKMDGQWVPRRVYLERQSAKYAQFLREAIQNANPPGSFNLSDDSSYTALLAIGASLPKAKTLAADLLALNQRLGRGATRKDILKRLEEAGATYEASVPLVAQLEGLQPAEDPAASAFLGKWKSAMTALDALEPVAKSAAEALEANLADFHSTDQAPEFSEETRTHLRRLGDQLRAFRAGNPPPALNARVAGAVAVEAVGAGFMELGQSLPARKVFEAKTTLDAMAPQARDIGPQCGRVVSEFQKSIATRIEFFTKTRDEAKSLAEGDKPAEAIAKYEEALAIIADPTVESALADLKAASAQP